MTTITPNQAANFFELTSSKGRKIGVSVRPDYISVYIRRAGLRHCAHGRMFWASTTQEAFLAAIDAYKTADVKAALRALLSELL